MRAAGYLDGMADGRPDVNAGRVVGPPGNVLVRSDQQELLSPGVGRGSVEDGERDSEVAGAAPQVRDRRLACGSVAAAVGGGTQEGEARPQVVVERRAVREPPVRQPRPRVARG